MDNQITDTLQRDSVCHFKSHTEPLEPQESHGFRHSRCPSVSLKMTPEACCFGGVLTGGLLKETEEEGFTFVTQNVTHNIR